jgi:hypothetical protein
MFYLISYELFLSLIYGFILNKIKFLKKKPELDLGIYEVHVENYGFIYLFCKLQARTGLYCGFYPSRLFLLLGKEEE